MSNLNDFKSEISAIVGRSGDSTVESFVLRGANVAQYMIALLLEPGSLRTSNSVTAVASSETPINCSSLTRFLRVDAVRNLSNANKKVYYIPFQSYDLLEVTGDNVQYYSMHGNLMYYKPLPTTNDTLKIFYLQYPARWTTGEFPYPEHEDWALTITASFVWASLEETEDSAMWQKFAESVGVGSNTQTLLKRILTKEVDLSDDHLRGAV